MNFRETMDAMKEHYKNGATIPFALNTACSLGAQTDVLPDPAVTETNNFHDFTKNFNVAEQTGITQNAQTYESNKNMDDFKQKMNDLRNKSKNDADAKIDDFFDKMTSIGEQHPSSQDVILNTVSDVMKFFQGLLDTISKFCQKVIDQIVAWAKEVYKAVSNFFSDTASSIENFFSGVFSSVKILDYAHQ